MATVLPVEAQRVQEIAEKYKRRGYHVRIAPPAEELPSFLRAFQPNLIAESDKDGGVVVEVKMRETVPPEYWRELTRSVLQHPGWRLEILAIDPSEMVSFATIEETEIHTQLTEVQSLLRGQHLQAALLLAWATVEAAMRYLVEKYEVEVRDTAAGTLITQLYTSSLMDREDYDFLTELQRKRNAIAHGFQSDISSSELNGLVQIIEKLLNE
jgi:hypothetical protein